MNLLELLMYISRGNEKFVVEDSRGLVFYKGVFNSMLTKASYSLPGDSSTLKLYMFLVKLDSDTRLLASHHFS